MLRHIMVKGQFLLLLSVMCCSVFAAPQSLTLQPHSEVITPDINFSAPVKQWLVQHPIIKVAVWQPAQPPIYMDNDPSTYEGMAADYLHVLERAMDVKVEVMRFPSAELAQQALRAGEVDMLSAFNPDVYPENDILASTPWLLDHSALLLRNETGAITPDSLKGKTLSYIANNSRQDVLAQEYPGSTLKAEPSYVNAVTSVAWGQSQAAWINRASAEYLITYGFADKLQVLNSPVLSNLNLSFGVKSSDPLLLRAINETLGRIPLASRIGIATRWGLNSDHVAKANPLALTTEEQNWLRTHPVLTVLFNASTAPNAFINKNGQLDGAAVDLFKLLSARYGMKFNFVAAQGRSELLRLGQNNPDALYATVPVIPDIETTWNVITTRPYMIAPAVLMVSAATPPLADLTPLRGQKIAVTEFNPLATWLHKYYPEINLVTTNTAQQGYDLLSKGDVAGMVTTQYDADFLLATKPDSNLRVGIALGNSPGTIAMGANPSNTQLIGIMNKALLDVPPELLRRIYINWQPHADIARQPSWRDWQDVIIKVAVGVALVIALLLLWNRHIHNISRQRESARRALLDQLTFVRTLIDASPIALYVLDRDQRLIHSNPALRLALNDDADQALADLLLESDQLDAQVKDRLKTIVDRVMAGGAPEIYEGPLMLNNAISFVHHWIVPWRDANGEVVGVIGGWLDITEKEKLVSDLRHAKDEAVLANESKSVFLSSMSHEIRTPMNAIIGLLELEVKDHQQHGISNENVRVAWESAKALLLLIGDILDLSKIESGTYQLQPTCIELPQLVVSVVQLFTNRAHEKGLALTLDVELEHSHYLLDPLMVTQIVSNLVSNAIKFTDSGSVTVSVYQAPDSDAGKVDLVIDVTDSGQGLSPEQQERIFAPFVQVEGRKARQGTGLGLSICRRLADLMSGELQVESELGEGASFIFYFSAPTCEPEAQIIATASSLQSLHVLIVDDHSPNRLLLTQQLEMMGHHVSAAESGQQALAMFEADSSIHLIITDITMPGMDGFELTQRIRQREQQLGIAPRPVLGLTAHAQSSVVEQCLQAGMSDCLFKPIRSKQLHETVNRLLGLQQQPLNLPLPDEEKRKQARRFLHDEVIRTNRSDLNKLIDQVAQRDRSQIAKMAHRLLGGARIMQATELEQASEWLENISQDENYSDQQLDQALITVIDCVERLEVKLKSE
ncbi:transporter substrate-binding domain-containing protein [Pantoea sp.]|uniref:response regulator n=1 Tax=Pantoea sp. TaxID=69393 RepID=UPI0031D1FF2D